MGIITGIIGESAFEKIRNRLYEIVVDELEQQSAITYDDDFLDATVYLERMVPFQLSEMPAVNISFVSGDADKETKNTADRTYGFNIDFYGASPTTSTERGDLRASMRVQRLMAVVDAILRDKRYITLQFQKPFIMNTRVESVKIGNPTDTKDAANVVLGRLVFNVRVPECVQDIEPRDLPGYSTQVLIDESSSGYVYSGDNVPPLDPTCAPVAVLVNDQLLADVDSGGTLSFQVVNTLGLEVGTWNYYTEQWVVPASGGLPVGVDLNGSSLTNTPAGQTKNMVITYADLSPVLITPTTDDANNFAGTIPNLTVYPIAYDRPKGTATTSFYQYDEADLLASGVYDDFTVGIKPILVDFWNLHASTPNAYGTTKRFTGKTGGYQSELDSLFYDINDVLTTELLAFPDDYVVDHKTKIGWPRDFYAINQKLDIQLPIINDAAFNFAGYTGDWRIACDSEATSIFNNESSILGVLKAIPFKYSINKWMTCTTTGASTYLAYTSAAGSAASNASVPFNSSSVLICRTHIF